MNTQRVEGHTPTTKLPWQSYWRTDEDGHADCGIFSEVVKGHAYSVCRAPRYQTKEQWEADSAFILYACNNIERLEKVNEALVARLEEIHYIAKKYPGDNPGTAHSDNIRLADAIRADIPHVLAALSLAKEPA